MSIFLTSLKKSGRLDGIHITACIVGSRKIEKEDDYGNSGWNIFAPNLTIYGFDAEPQVCEQLNRDIESRNLNWTEKHIPLALGKTLGKAKLYVTQFPGCSSLYLPNEPYLQRFSGVYQDMHKLVNTTEVELTTLDNYCHECGIREIDFLQIDVQGAELDVLQGASEILTSVLAIQTEVEFSYLYVNQPLFGDVDVYLKNKGFTLFDFTIQGRAVRHSSPIVSDMHPGSLIGGDAFYFKDLLVSKGVEAERLLKLACLADIMKFYDYALEILEYLTLNYGEYYNFADNIIESLQLLKLEGLDCNKIISKLQSYGKKSQLQTKENPDIFSNYISKFRQLNLIFFPDWSQSESQIVLDLEIALRSLFAHPSKSKITLLIASINFSESDAKLILSSVIMNMFMQFNIDVTEEPEILLISDVSETEWKELLPYIHFQISLKKESILNVIFKNIKVLLPEQLIMVPLP